MTTQIPAFTGVPSDDSAWTAEEGARTLTLPSGATAIIRRATGADLRLAARHATPGGEDRSVMALAASLVRIDGRSLYPDELDALPLPDFMVLQAAVAAGGPTWARKPSSTSGPTSDGPQA